jgi:hypothetical protein
MSNIVASERALPGLATVRRGAGRSRVYPAVALVGAALGVVGFWTVYFGPLLAGAVPSPERPWIASSLVIHLHVVMMVTWLGLFVAQAWSAASGRIRLHLRLGPWVMGYGVVMLTVALLAISEGFAARLATGDVFRAQRWLFGTLRDVVFIGAFLAAGWAYRRRPEVHKRLMLVATTIVIMPAIGRMPFLGPPTPFWGYVVLWPIPVYLAMVHDFRTRRLIHPVYFVGLAAMLAMRLVLPLGASPTWQSIAAHVTVWYQPPAAGR